MTLKLKAVIYRWTGIFLAKREEAEYLQRSDTQAKILEWSADLKMDMSYEDAVGLAKGLWHMRHGFHRPLSFLVFREPSWFWAPVARVHELSMLIRWKLQDVWKVLCGKS
jgi:hypothetical protein